MNWLALDTRDPATSRTFLLHRIAKDVITLTCSEFVVKEVSRSMMCRRKDLSDTIHHAQLYREHVLLVSHVSLGDQRLCVID